MIRYFRANDILNIDSVDLKSLVPHNYGDSVVDKSKFRPNVNDVHNFTGGSSRVGLYDFPDGIDNGLRLGALRNIGADITEIEATRDNLTQRVKGQSNEIDNIVKVEVDKALSKVKNKPDSSDVVTGSSSTNS